MFKAPNHIFQNWNKDLYIANKSDVVKDEYNNQIVTYSKPFYFGKVNYQPLTKKDLEATMNYLLDFKSIDDDNVSLVFKLIDKIIINDNKIKINYKFKV